VFAGGATVEAAEAITGAGVDTLDRLVTKSLLVRRRQADGSTRLGMLATIREYAGEQFAAVADGEAVRERHFRFFLAFARRHAADQAILGPDRTEHRRRLDADFENLFAALAWASELDGGGPLLELSASLGEYWFICSRYADAVAFIDRALSKPGADRAPELRVRALRYKSWALWPLGRKSERAMVVAEAKATARALADPAVLSQLLYTRAVQESHTRNRLEVASALADEALSCAQAAGDPWTLAMVAHARAVTSGGSAELRERVDQAASLLHAVGNRYHLADVFHMAVYRALCIESDRLACDFASRAVPLVRELDDPYLWMLMRCKVGLAALFTGDTEVARDAFREQLELCQEMVIPATAYEGLVGLAAVAAVRHDLDRAARLFGSAAAHRQRQPEDAIEARLHLTFFQPARTRRGPDAWDAGVREGAALGVDDAIAYALSDGRTAKPPVPAGHAR
jgi:tetratricopeptide (TPR) repeat protein